jgi:hypothetical protein
MLPVPYPKSAAIRHEKSNLKTDNKLVVVYNSRIDSLLTDLSESAKNSTITSITADWMLFMDDLNAKMFKKISF